MPDQSSAASEHALMQEITAPLETLPDDPLALVEADFPTAMRGYDRHAVDDYVAQVSRLVAELHATRSPEAAVRRALERVGDQISGVLQRAHETAEQITARSRAEAEDRLEQARREAATIVDAAAQRVRELDADADRIWAERQRIIADAEDLSTQLRAVAREATERFPSDEVRPAPEESSASAPAPVSPWTDPGDGEDSQVGEDGEADLDAEEPIELELEEESEPVEPEPEPVEPEPVREPSARDDVPDVERTQRFSPSRLTDDDSTRIIPPSSDAAQHRHDA